jgi:hypothetical protein
MSYVDISWPWGLVVIGLVTRLQAWKVRIGALFHARFLSLRRRLLVARNSDVRGSRYWQKQQSEAKAKAVSKTRSHDDVSASWLNRKNLIMLACARTALP